jgi:hypothetical protein
VNENEKLNIVADIHRKLAMQTRRMLQFISEEFKGMEIEILHLKGSDMSFVKSFLPGKQVWINIEAESDDGTDIQFSLSLFSLFNDEYEFKLNLYEENDMFKLIPPEIINGLKNSLKLKRTLSIKLGERPS